MNSLEATQVTAPNGKTDDCAKFTITAADSTYTFQDITMVGQEYVFGCYVKSDAAGAITVGDETMPTSSTWTRFVYKFTASDVDFIMTFAAAGVYYIYNSKLEIGTVDTDWSPAPEDIFQKTAEIEITVDGITSTVTDLEGNVSKVEQTAESIESTVADLEGNLTSLELSVDGLTSTVSDVEGNMSQLTQTVNGLQSTVTDLEGNYSSLTQTVNGVEVTLGQVQDTADGLKGSLTLFNGSFESGTTTGWTYNGANSPYVNTTSPYSGSYKLVFPYSSGGNKNLVNNSYIPVRANQKLRITCALFPDSTEASSSIGFLLSNGNTVTVGVSITGGTWHVYTGVVTIPSGVTTARARIAWNPDSAGNMRVDSVIVEDVTDAQEAAKTATNYLSFSSSGLVVGNRTGTLRGNVLLNSSGMQVRNGTSIYATYGANQIELARNNVSSQIKMCNGVVSIYADSSYGRLSSSRGLGLLANGGQAQLTGSSGVLIGKSSAITYIYGSSVQALAGGSMRTLKPVYRLYNPYDKCYLETADSSEASSLVSQGWQQHSTNVFYAFK